MTVLRVDRIPVKLERKVTAPALSVTEFPDVSSLLPYEATAIVQWKLTRCIWI